MKKIILTAGILISMTIGCSEADTTTFNESELLISKSATIPYAEQFPYITVENMNSLQQFNRDNDIHNKSYDTSVSWQYFDSLYSPTLSGDIKENLGFIILVKKDLIAAVNQNPNNSVYSDALKKYVDILIGESYIGYTTLYFALDALKTIDADFVSNRASKIDKYSKFDSFQPGIIEDESVDESTLAKITSNYQILTKIQLL